jgi:chromosomal replication initiation ATPase DnaA
MRQPTVALSILFPSYPSSLPRAARQAAHEAELAAQQQQGAEQAPPLFLYKSAGVCSTHFVRALKTLAVRVFCTGA